MNSTLEKISAVWTLATGRPLPFLPEPKTIPAVFPVFFPLIGLAIGLACSLAAWIVVWLFGTFAGSMFSGVLIALLLEILTGWRGFNGAALFASRFARTSDDAAPDKFIAQPIFFGAVFFAVRAILIASVVQAGGAHWMTAILLCAYFAREELSAATTPAGGELIKASVEERRKGAVAGCVLMLLFILVSRRIWGAAGLFLLTWLISWYLVKRSENGTLDFDRRTFETAAYLMETVLLILTAICVHR
jgi:cobalamin synthase